VSRTYFISMMKDKDKRIAELEDALEESHRVAEVLKESNGNYADFNKKLQEEVQELTNQLIAMHKGELHD
jgi:arginine deiminase